MDLSLQSATDVYQSELDELAVQGQARRCRVVGIDTDRGGWPCILVDGVEAVDFCSNNYLGLADDPRLKAAAVEATRQWGVGARASRLVSGTSAEVAALEEAVAEFKGTEAAVVFNSGYQANVGLLEAVLDTGDWVFMDRLNHASLIDGAQLSGARVSRYAHLDFEHLETKLQKAPRDARKWIVSDTVFSMDGDTLSGKLTTLLDMAEKYDAWVLLDESHATGLWGDKRHSGIVEAEGETGRVTLQMGTFSKALGGFGAYVAGSRVMTEYLVNRCRSLIYSTALPPAVVASAMAAVELVQTDDARHRQLWDNVDVLSRELQTLSGAPEGQDVHAESPIIPVLLGKQAMAVCDALLERGYFVQGIRPPTVPEGTERLRICVSAAHHKEQLVGLASSLGAVLGDGA